MNIVSNKDLYRACHILFGHGVDVTYDFLLYIQPSGVKSAYRRSALNTHPDRLATEDPAELKAGTDRFIETQWAYKHLMGFVKKRDGLALKRTALRAASDFAAARPEPKRRRAARAWSGSSAGGPRARGNYYMGRMPERRLMLGEYLFYRSVIPWEALIKAIVWQRRQRPRIGALALKWGYLNDFQLRTITRCRRLGEHFGATAIRLGLLSRAQLGTLLLMQRRMHRPFGEYFVSNSYLGAERLSALLADFAKHNNKYAS